MGKYIPKIEPDSDFKFTLETFRKIKKVWQVIETVTVNNYEK